MEHNRRRATLILLAAIALTAQAQTFQRDGDHMVTNAVGRSFLAIDSPR